MIKIIVNVFEKQKCHSHNPDCLNEVTELLSATNSPQPSHTEFTLYLTQWVPRSLWRLPLWLQCNKIRMTLVLVIVFSEYSLYFAHNNRKGSTGDDSAATVLLADGI